MNIGIVMHRPPAAYDIVERNRLQLLIQVGFDLELYVDENGDEFSLCPVHRLPRSGSVYSFLSTLYAFFRHPFRSIRMIRAERRDKRSWAAATQNFQRCLHLINGPRLIYVEFSSLAESTGRENVGRMMNTMLICNLKNPEFVSGQNRHQLLWSKLRKVFSLSDALLDDARKLGMPGDFNVWKFPPAVHTLTEKIKPSIPRLSGDKFKLFTFHSCFDKEEFNAFINLVKSLKQSGASFEWVVGTENNIAVKIQSLSAENAISGDLNIKPVSSGSQLLELLAGCDIYVQSYSRNSVNTLLFAAQAMGKICLVDESDLLTEWIEHGMNGWKFNSGINGSLASAVAHVSSLSSDSLHAVCSEAAARMDDGQNFTNRKLEQIYFYLMEHQSDMVPDEE
jgi:hypothetical protein